MIRTIGFAEVCLLPCGNSTFMALGVTIVDVIIKNINNRNMMSVIDDIEKASIVLVFLFNIIIR
jgi:hypothetical protein